jgi:hypothetical protein
MPGHDFSRKKLVQEEKEEKERESPSRLGGYNISDTWIMRWFTTDTCTLLTLG